MDFGVTVLPDPPFSRWLELIQLAERHGFGYAWTYDSHVLWQESVPMLAAAAADTPKINLGRYAATRAPVTPACRHRAYAAPATPAEGRMGWDTGPGTTPARYTGPQPMK